LIPQNKNPFTAAYAGVYWHDSEVLGWRRTLDLIDIAGFIQNGSGTVCF